MEELIILLNLVSSAKMHIIQLVMYNVRSLIYRMKSSGLRMLLWGTPDEKGNRLDRTSVIETHCNLEVK